jgi:hypothetical protein
MHLLYLTLTIKILKNKKLGSLQTPFVEALIISLKFVELIVSVIVVKVDVSQMTTNVIISIIVNPISGILFIWCQCVH